MTRQAGRDETGRDETGRTGEQPQPHGESTRQRRDVPRRASFPEGRGPSKRGDPPIEERHGPRSRHGDVERSREEP